MYGSSVPNRTYVPFIPVGPRGKVANFTGLAMSPARFRQTYENQDFTQRAVTVAQGIAQMTRNLIGPETFIGTTKDMWEHEQERQLNYNESLARTSDIITDFKIEDDGELGHFE